MTCESCNKSKKKTTKDFTKAVIEIDNPEKLVLFRKVVIPASMGTKDDFPPVVGKYYNVLLQYEADGDLYIYSSDGIPTQLSSDVSELQHQLEQLGIKLDDEIANRIVSEKNLSDSIDALTTALNGEALARQNADAALQTNINNASNALNGRIDTEILNRGAADDTLQDNITALDNSLATVAKSGSYNDLINKPTIGNATLTIKRNNSNAGTFTANATTNKSINISVPTKTSDLTNDGANGTSTYVEADDLPTVDTVYSSSSNNAIANSTVTNSLDRDVMTNLALNSTPSTTTINLDSTKTNLASPSSTTTTSISFPVASTTQAGVMNSSTFDAITANTSNINAIMNGAVAITGLPASPTQSELTTAWENETGLSSLMNRASIYDVTNQKVWTYYMNDTTWHAASNTSQVTVSTFTNSSEGIIKGSTNDGQVFAENDGTGSVNGWDTLTASVSSNTSKLATIASGAEVNVQSNWTQTNSSADDYIKNKPANLVQDASYVHTDNNFTTTLKNKLDGIESGAEVNVQADWTQADSSADDYIKNKPSNLVQDANYVHTDNNFTTTLKNKLNGIASGAEVNQNAFSNVLVNGTTVAADTKTDTLTLTAGSNITLSGDASNDTVTISATNNDTTYTFADGTNSFTVTPSGGSAQTVNVTPSIADATTSTAGLMSAADKTKLNGIASGAEANVQSDWNQSNSSADDYIKNKPSIPTVNNATLTIQKNGTTVQTFTANSSTNKTANITVPTVVSELTNDANYINSTVLDYRLATKQNSLTAGNAINITSNVISADVYPDDYFTNSSDIISGEGSNFVVNDTVEAKIKSIVPKGNTFQQTYGGKNIFPLDTGSYTNHGFTSIYNADGSITVSGTADATCADLTANKTVNYEQGKTYTFSIAEALPFGLGLVTLGAGAQREDINIIAGNKSGNKTLSYTHNIAKLYIYNLTVGQSYSFTIYPMVEEGSTVSPFEPYVGGIPAPNPDYPQDVQVVTGEQIVEVTGKNLINIPNFTASQQGITAKCSNQTIELTGTAGNTYYPDFRFYKNGTYGSRAYRSTVSQIDSSRGFFTEPNSEYKLSIFVEGDTSYAIVEGFETKVTNNLGLVGNQVITINDSERLNFVSISISQNVTANIKVRIQLEKGSATPYEPYAAPQSYTVDLGSIELCKIGGYQDYIYKSGDDWYVHKSTGKFTFYGSAISWSSGSEAGAGYYAWWKNTASIGLTQPQVDDNNTPTFLTNFKQMPYGTEKEQVGFMTKSSTTTPNLIFITDSSITTSAALNTALNGSEYYYALATPTDTKITDTTLIGQLETLMNAHNYRDATYVVTTATGTNLPIILDIDVYRKTLNGTLGAITTKQDKLIAGDNITIENNIISSTGDWIITLSPSDYDYPSVTPDGVALWSLPTGMYFAPTSVKIYGDSNTGGSGGNRILFVNSEVPGSNSIIYYFGAGIALSVVNKSTGVLVSDTSTVLVSQIVDDLNSTASDAPLSANQGKILNDKILASSYSTSEQNTGMTWVDGSTIYKKTINMGTLPNNATTTAAHGIQNLENVIKVEGWARNPNSLVGYISTSSLRGGGDPHIVLTSTHVGWTTTNDLSSHTDSYITLYYTKSS